MGPLGLCFGAMIADRLSHNRDSIPQFSTRPQILKVMPGRITRGAYFSL